MSIAAALSTALSGLSANTRAANVVSGNLANALTEGYGRREIELSPRWAGGQGGGVTVDGVRRLVDRTVIADRREAEARMGDASAQSAFLKRLTDGIGVPGTEGALSHAVAGLEEALIYAAAKPESLPRLAEAEASLAHLAGRLNEISDIVQTARTDADRQIGDAVATLNRNLAELEVLNADIRRYNLSGEDTGSLQDQRQALIDEVAEIVPVRELDREGGAVALMTPGGALLLDGRAAEIGFTRSHIVTPHMSREDGTLSGLTINGREILLDREPSVISGGTLAGHLAVRDGLAVEAQAGLDALARDLVDRFQDPATDPTLAATDPGILTDAGARFDPLDETGLAARLSVNALIDSGAGGELWRLRDGLGAAGPGDAGQAAGLQRLADALSTPRSPASGPAGAFGSASGLASDYASRLGARLEASRADVTRATVRAETLIAKEREGGVDSDQELQKLLQIEQAYAANARVIETVGVMFDTLMRI